MGVQRSHVLFVLIIIREGRLFICQQSKSFTLMRDVNVKNKQRPRTLVFRIGNANTMFFFPVQLSPFSFAVCVSVFVCIVDVMKIITFLVRGL